MIKELFNNAIIPLTLFGLVLCFILFMVLASAGVLDSQVWYQNAEAWLSAPAVFTNWHQMMFLALFCIVVWSK